MGHEHALPRIAQEIVSCIEGFELADALARLDDPSGGGALSAPLRGLLRARVLSASEQWHASYRLLEDVRGMRDLGALERVEAQVRTARVLRFASPLVDYALDTALAAARSGVRAGGAGVALAVEAHVEAALLFGRKRCRDLAREQVEAAAALGEDPSSVAIARAELALSFDDRVRAKEAFDEALAMASRLEQPAARAKAERLARLGLARLYTVLGEFDSAAVELGKLGPRPTGDVGVRRVKWRLLAAQAKWKEVSETLAEIVAAVPDGDATRGIMLEHASALYRAGDVDGARAAWTKIAASGGGDQESRIAARLLDRTSNAEGRRTRLLAFPSVAQLRNHCGPASVELCLRFFGTSADQVAVAREIKHPDGGTPVHRMRAYMEAAGFVSRRVEADLETLKKILDAGVPVIMEEDYSTSRHVAVAIGYDDRRQLVEVQDPMTHEVRETPYEELSKLREFSNDGALVSVPKDRHDLIAKLDAIGAVECTYMTITDKAWEAFDQERFEDADRLASEAIALHEPYELAWVLRFVRARNTFEKEQTDENKEALISILNGVLRLWPNDEWPQQFLGRVYALEDRPSEALAAFERARDRDPDDANNWCSIGDQHLALGNKEAAKKAFEEALRRDPGHVRSNENLADVVLDLGDLSLASLLNSCARELAKDNPFNHGVHGRILSKRQDLEGAVRAYERALEIAPDHDGYVVERSKLLARAGRIDEAIASLEKAIEAQNENRYLIVNLADLACAHDRLETCLAVCERLHALDPESRPASAIAGAALAKQGKLEEGLALLRATLSKQPRYSWVHREIGRALSKAGRHDEAIAAFAAAVGLSDAPEMIYALADALGTAGFADDAAHYARRAARSATLDQDQLLRCAELLKQAEGAGAAHGFFGSLGEAHPREIGIARAHALFLLERLWAPGAVAGVLSRLSVIAPDDPLVLANEADDLMDASMSDEPRGEALFRRAIAAAPSLVAPRRLYARQLVSRGRFAEALSVLEPLRADAETAEDRVNALLGLRRDADARAAVEAFAAAQPEEVREKSRRPLDYQIAKIEHRWEDALALATAIASDEGELEDDGELGRWEKERFQCLVELRRGDEAYEFGVAQCADAEDKGYLAYTALASGDLDLARRLGEESFEEDESEDYAQTVLARLADLAGDVARARELWTKMKEASSWHIHDENLGRLALADGDLATAKEALERAIERGHVCPVAFQLRAELRLLSGDREGARSDAERARACTRLEHRDTSENIDAFLAGLAGKKDEARALYDRYLAREKLAASDRARFAKLDELF